MFATVDIPILRQKPDGEYDRAVPGALPIQVALLLPVREFRDICVRSLSRKGREVRSTLLSPVKRREKNLNTLM
jgi:hypothetical protein